MAASRMIARRADEPILDIDARMRHLLSVAGQLLQRTQTLEGRVAELEEWLTGVGADLTEQAIGF